MTLTAPGCPVAGDMPAWVESAVGAVEGVSLARVKMVFNPPWDPSRMSDEARIALNCFNFPATAGYGGEEEEES